MQELISTVDQEFLGNNVKAIDARQLHGFLGSKQHFADWIKSRVLNNSFFMEDIDFIVFHNSMKNTAAGRGRIDYALTMDTAKKVSMMENTEAGNKARDYFLECEKVANGSVGQPAIIGSRKEAFELELIGAEHAARILMVSDNSRLDMVHAVYENNGVPVVALPQYTEKVRIVASATDLLKKNECEHKVRAFNKAMVEAGYLEIRDRLSSGGKNKKFKALTEKGLEFGQNDAYRGGSTQVQVHYFDDCFMGLYALLF